MSHWKCPHCGKTIKDWRGDEAPICRACDNEMVQSGKNRPAYQDPTAFNPNQKPGRR